MSNTTSINPNLIEKGTSSNDSNATVINPLSGNISATNSEQSNVTQLNSEISSAQSIAPGTILCNEYVVISRLETQTGEANLYICEKNSEQYVAKVYRRKVAVKHEIINKLLVLESEYVAKVYSTGEYAGFPVEIIPYYKNGSLQGKKYTYLELKKHIIPSLNEGLHVLHENGIIHKDLKPSNIMLNDNKIDVSIIDFGISSIRDVGSTVIVTQTGMTPEYSAPETFRNLFLVESDYYSFGITIYELFTGKTPYSGMNEEDIEKYVSVQHIPFPDDMPDDLKNLISALTYNDITNRKNKSNPNRRWCYEEVKRWCNGDEQVIPGEGIGNYLTSIAPYKFKGVMYNDKPSLVDALATNWEDGKKQLFRGLLSGYFKTIDPEMAGICIDAEEAVDRGNDPDIVFFRTLYRIDDTTDKFYWKGTSCASLQDLGIKILNLLWNKNKQVDPYAGGILKNRILTSYCKAVGIDDMDVVENLDGLENTFSSVSNSFESRIKLYFIMSYMLSGKKVFNYKGRKFKTIDKLTEFMNELAKSSYSELKEFCYDLMNGDGELEAQFESWLICLGKQAEISEWKKSLSIG